MFFLRGCNAEWELDVDGLEKDEGTGAFRKLRLNSMS
jgi:hypothetical protein